MNELQSGLLVEQRSLVVSLDGRSWHAVALDDPDLAFVVPLAVGTRDVLALGSRQGPVADLYLVPLQE